VRQLSGVDALHVLEETPGQHMHTIKLAIVGPRDGAPVPVEEIKQWARERLPRIPAMRWMVAKIPMGLGRPVFLDAGPFDVDPHLFVERLTTGSAEEFDELVSVIASSQLRRDRPLWELTIVTGLSAGRTGLIFKIHHAVMDGQASVRFFELAFDSGVDVEFDPVPRVAEQVPTKTQLASFALGSQARLYRQLPQVVRRSVSSARVNRARKASGAPPVVNPMSGPSTRFNRLPLPDRIYVDVSVPFARMSALKAATGSTINEVFVTLCGGAIRRYLAAHDETPDKGLNVAHPVSLRRPEEIDNFGNRTSYWYVALGTDVEDPLERLAVVKQSLDAAKEWAKGDTELFAVWQDYYLLFGTLTLKMLTVAERVTRKPLFNAVVSNVRGPRPLELAGAPVVAVRSMGPITRVLGLNLTAWSYGDTFSIGVHSCREFMPDLRTMTRHLLDELEALESAAGRRLDLEALGQDDRVPGVGPVGQRGAELGEQA
jgi:diacylglycerol O-acyltransferase / wax synthase